MAEDVTTEIFPAASIPSQPFWPALHALYNSAYISVVPTWPLPQPFYRLHPDLAIAGPQFVRPLGAKGFVAVSFAPAPADADASGNLVRIPIAAASAGEYDGVLYSNGEQETRQWSADAGAGAGERVVEWEFNHVVTDQTWRGRGLGKVLVGIVEEEVVRRTLLEAGEEEPGQEKRVRVRMVTRTMEEISGTFWRARGYATVKDMYAVLPKGFTHMEGYNGFKREIEFWGGEKWLR